MASFEMVLICAAVFLAGALVGFGVATIYTSAHMIRLYDEKHDLARKVAEPEEADRKAKASALALKVPTIEISDSTVADGVDFSKDWG